MTDEDRMTKKKFPRESSKKIAATEEMCKNTRAQRREYLSYLSLLKIQTPQAISRCTFLSVPLFRLVNLSQIPFIRPLLSLDQIPNLFLLLLYFDFSERNGLNN